VEAALRVIVDRRFVDFGGERLQQAKGGAVGVNAVRTIGGREGEKVYARRI
jgi:hypothetical protein